MTPFEPADALTVREYRPSDADAVWRVHEAALRASSIAFVPDAPTDEDLRNVAEAYDEDTFLVGAVDGEVVATGAYRQQDPTTVEIRRMRVHPDHQGRGYGRRLLRALERRAAEAGADRAVLETHEDLEAARSLYEGDGYQETDRSLHPVGDHEVIRYERRLRLEDRSTRSDR